MEIKFVCTSQIDVFFYGMTVVLQSKISCKSVILITETRQRMNYGKISSGLDDSCQCSPG